MHRACRNLGTRGLVMQAISAVDIAWWDLKARLLDASLSHLFGRSRDIVPIYGSGGFCTLTDAELADQVRWWRSVGCSAMKIKIGESWGTRPARDLERVRRLREHAGDDAELMVDANGAYTAGQARRIGAALDELGVTWFEEPVSSDDVAGLASLRAALRCDVTAGEYAADVYEVERLLPVVDCFQLDATRCGGYTGWLRCAALAQARNLAGVRTLRALAARPGSRRDPQSPARGMVRRSRPPRTTARRRPTRSTQRRATHRSPHGPGMECG